MRGTQKILVKLHSAGASRRLTPWIAACELLLALVLAGAGIIARMSGLLTGAELSAWAFAYILIASGVLVTGYKMEGSSSTRI
jgi:hypothetical protein